MHIMSFISSIYHINICVCRFIVIKSSNHKQKNYILYNAYLYLYLKYNKLLKKDIFINHDYQYLIAIYRMLSLLEILLMPI